MPSTTAVPVRLNNHRVIIEAIPVNDKFTDEALDQARFLLANGYSFSEALVDRFDGLALIGPDGNWHFTTPLCGYGGTGPQVAAEILAMFNFGSKAEIMTQIDHGGDAAKARFSR